MNIGTLPFEATITPDKITKDMIMDYQKNKDRGYIDPITNTEYKYIPTGMNLDVADLIPKYRDDANLGRPPTRDDVKNYRVARGKLINDLRKAKADSWSAASSGIRPRAFRIIGHYRHNIEALCGPSAGPRFKKI